MTLQQALALLQDIINSGKRHQDYKHVVALATLYKQITTGTGAEKLLQPFVKRETDEEFKLRVDAFVNITQAVARKVMTGFYRVGRLDNAKKVLGFEEAENNIEARLKKLQDTLAVFHGSNDLEEYLATRFVQLSFTDPNAFIAIDFKSFDARYETAKPYPVELPSSSVIDFGYDNNELEYLAWLKSVMLPAKKAGEKDIEAPQYTLYVKDYVIKLTEQPDTAADEQGANYVQLEKGRFKLQVFNSGGGAVQAIRVGYENDLDTDGRTKVNPLHDAIPFFKKMVKNVSEFDLSTCNHVFPQKVSLALPCEGAVNDSCNGGKNMAGDTCTVCNGTGFSGSHRSAQDEIILPMPDRNTVNPIKVTEVLAYFTPPVELLKFQDEQIEKLSTKVLDTIYGNDILAKTTVAQTATERTDKKDEMYNALYPFAKQYSNVYRFAVRLCAAFTDNAKGLIVIHEFPKDFKLKTTTELLADLEQATKSGAPAFVIQSIHKDIADKLFIDDEEQHLEYMVKAKFTPFLGKDVKEVQFILTSGYARVEDRVLYTHSDTIFDELKQEVPNFFKLGYTQQWQLIKKKIEEIAPALEMNNQAGALDFRDVVPGATGDTADDTPIDLELEAKAKLKGSVGGIQGLLQIAESVAKGMVQYEAGVTMAVEIFGYSEEVVRKMLGDKEALVNAPVV